MMISELEGVALRLFEERGFADVTVQDIAAEAQISVRTFYRYFPAKDDVLLLRIERRGEAFREALARADPAEPPLRALRMAVCEVAASEDPRAPASGCRWSRPSRACCGPSLAASTSRSTRCSPTSSVPAPVSRAKPCIPRMLAAAAGGVLEAAHTQWFLQGGDLVTTLSDSLEVLERAIGSDPRGWTLEGSAPARVPTGRPRSRAVGVAR